MGAGTAQMATGTHIAWMSGQGRVKFLTFGVFPTKKPHVETLQIYKLGFTQKYYTFALILLKIVVLFGRFP